MLLVAIRPGLVRRPQSPRMYSATSPISSRMASSVMPWPFAISKQRRVRFLRRAGRGMDSNPHGGNCGSWQRSGGMDHCFEQGRKHCEENHNRISEYEVAYISRTYGAITCLCPLVGKQKLARTLDKRSELGIIGLGAFTKTRCYLGSPIAAPVPLQTVAGSCEFHSRRRRAG